MLLRSLRDPDTGGPSRGARLLAALVVVGMLALTAPVLYPAVAWVLGLF